jgi:flavin reductase (DIM6/NTAB) family NADH-FMN oxidoreductase RutF
VTPDLFKQIASHWLTGVSIVTATAADGELCGMTMSAVSSLSLEPPQFLACFDRRAKTLAAVQHSKHFAIHFLSEHQKELSNHFARRGADRFKDIPHRMSDSGVPILDDVIAVVECSLASVLDGGDHAIVIGDAIHGSVAGGHPLAYFHGGYRRVEP